jgi:hypothetical protein
MSGQTRVIHIYCCAKVVSVNIVRTYVDSMNTAWISETLGGVRASSPR